MKKKKQKNGIGGSKTNVEAAKFNNTANNLYDSHCTTRSFNKWIKTLEWDQLCKAMEFAICTSGKSDLTESGIVSKRHQSPNSGSMKISSVSSNINNDHDAPIVMFEHEFNLLREMVCQLPCLPYPIHPRATGHINIQSNANDGHNEESLKKDYRMKRPRLFQWQSQQSDQSDVTLQNEIQSVDTNLIENFHPSHHRRRNRNTNLMGLKSDSLVNDATKTHSYNIIARKFVLDDGERLSLSYSVEQQHADNAILEGTIVNFGCFENLDHDHVMPYPRISFEYKPSRCQSHIMNDTQVNEIVIRILRVASRGHFGKHLPPLSLLEERYRCPTKDVEKRPIFLMPWLKTEVRWFSLPMYLANCFEVALWFSFFKHVHQRHTLYTKAQEVSQQHINSNLTMSITSDIVHNQLLQKSIYDVMKQVMKEERESVAHSKSFDPRSGLIWNIIDTEPFCSLYRCKKQYTSSDCMWTCCLIDLDSKQELWKSLIRQRYSELVKQFKQSMQESMVHDLLSQLENDEKSKTATEETKRVKNKKARRRLVGSRTMDGHDHANESVDHVRKELSESSNDQTSNQCTKQDADKMAVPVSKGNRSFPMLEKSAGDHNKFDVLMRCSSSSSNEDSENGSWKCHPNDEESYINSSYDESHNVLSALERNQNTVVSHLSGVALNECDLAGGIDEKDAFQIVRKVKSSMLDKLASPRNNSESQLVEPTQMSQDSSKVVNNSLNHDEFEEKEILIRDAIANEKVPSFDRVVDHPEPGFRIENELKSDHKPLLASHLLYRPNFLQEDSCSTIKKSNVESHIVRTSDFTKFPSSGFFAGHGPEKVDQVPDTKDMHIKVTGKLVVASITDPIVANSIEIAALSENRRLMEKPKVNVSDLEGERGIDDNKSIQMIQKLDRNETPSADCTWSNEEESKKSSVDDRQRIHPSLSGRQGMSSGSPSSDAALSDDEPCNTSLVSSMSRRLSNSFSPESSSTAEPSSSFSGAVCCSEGNSRNRDILENAIPYDHLNLQSIRSFGSEPTATVGNMLSYDGIRATPTFSTSSDNLRVSVLEDKSRAKDQPKKKPITSPRPLRVLDSGPPRAGVSLMRAERSRDDYDIKSRGTSVARRPVDALSSYRNPPKRITGSRDDQDIGPVVSRVAPPKIPSFKAFSGKVPNQMNNSWSCAKTFHPESSRRAARNVNLEPGPHAAARENYFSTRSETALDDRNEYQHWHESYRSPANEEFDSNTVTKDGSTTITSALSPRETEEFCILKEERNSYRDMCLTLGAEVAKLKNMLASQLTTSKRSSTEFQIGYRHYPTRNGIFADPDSLSHHAFHIAPRARTLVAMSDAGFGGDCESLVSEDDLNTGRHFPGENMRQQTSSITKSGSDTSLDHTSSQNNVHMPFIGIRPTRDGPDPVSLNGMQSRLSKDIMQFLESINSQLHKLDGKRQAAVERMTRIVNTLWPRAQVKLYGSHVTGLSLPSSDLDFVVCLPAVHKNTIAIAAGELEVRNAINESSQKLLARRLKAESWIDPRSMKLIERTVVPVIKVSTKDNKARTLQLDITFDAPGHHGLEAVDMVLRIMDELPMIRPIMIVLKQFLIDRGLLTAYTGGLSSYCLFLMVARYLQEQPSSWGDCGALLMGFLDFYGNCVSLFVLHAGCYRS